jgi:hypothetical protein
VSRVLTAEGLRLPATRPGTPNDQAWIESLFGARQGREPSLGEE